MKNIDDPIYTTLAGIYACGCIFAAVRKSRMDAWMLAGDWQKEGYRVVGMTDVEFRQTWGEKCSDPQKHYK